MLAPVVRTSTAGRKDIRVQKDANRRCSRSGLPHVASSRDGGLKAARRLDRAQTPLVNLMMTSIAIPLIYIALLVAGGLVAFLLPRGPIGGR